MTKQVTKLTDAVTQSTSRRGFLGRLARLAGSAAVALGALTASHALAARRGKKNCCVYSCLDYDFGIIYFITNCSGGRCQEQYKGCTLASSKPVSDCNDCQV